MLGKKTPKKPTFTKASTPEGIRKQRAAIKDYYIQKRKNKNSVKLGKPKQK